MFALFRSMLISFALLNATQLGMGSTVLNSTVLSGHRGHSGHSGHHGHLHHQKRVSIGPKATNLFKKMNPEIEWDPTKFLVDMSSQFANCDTISRGYKDIDEVTPGGKPIAVIYDYVEGNTVDVNNADAHLVEVIGDWMKFGNYDGTIQQAHRFGCSIQPNCNYELNNKMSLNVSTIACLFSLGINRMQGDQPRRTYDTSYEPQYRFGQMSCGCTEALISAWQRHCRSSYDNRAPLNLQCGCTENLMRAWTDHCVSYQPQPLQNPTRGPTPGEGVRALTENQQLLTEEITQHKWDHSYFLENLSGTEVSCSMIRQATWEFSRAIDIARDHQLRINGLKGASPNIGSTKTAIKIILKGFEQIRPASLVGCSVIPDCIDEKAKMWVVVACFYEKPY